MKKIRTLLVEDNIVQRKIMERALNTSSFEVIASAVNGEDALKVLGIMGENNLADVDLIISDHDMPVMNGYELLLEVKNSQLNKVPFVIISADEGTDDRINKCIAGGALMFLKKTVIMKDPSELYEAIVADGVLKCK